MIRFLQTDNRMVKTLIVVIIGAASISMVVYLIPGLTGAGTSSPDTYATVYPHWYSRFLSTGDPISQARVQAITENQLQQRNPEYASNPQIVQMLEPQIAQQLIQEQVMLVEAHRLGISATEDDVRKYLRTGPTGEVLYPNGAFIGDDAYKQLIDQRLHQSVTWISKARSRTRLRSSGCRLLSLPESRWATRKSATHIARTTSRSNSITR